MSFASIRIHLAALSASRMFLTLSMALLLILGTIHCASVQDLGHTVKAPQENADQRFAKLISLKVKESMAKSSNGQPIGADQQKFVDNAMRFVTLFGSIKTLGDTDATLKMGRALLDSGCKEPMVIWLQARLLYDSGKEEEAQPLLEQYCKLPQDGLPKICLFSMLKRLAALQNEKHLWDEERKSQSGALTALADSVSSGEFAKEEMPIACDILLGHSSASTPTFKIDGKLIWDNLKSRPNLDPWLKDMLEGKAAIDIGWAARGSGWANTVTPEGWKVFHEQIQHARELFTAAWNLHPEWPQAAAQMITVSMAGNDNIDTPEDWFKRAVAAQFDYQDAYGKYIYSLLPRWGGSHKALMNFGRECLDTGCFDTIVPYYYMIAIRDVANEMPNDAWRDAFREPGVYDSLQTMFKGYLKQHKEGPLHQSLLTSQALLEAWYGNREKASKLLKGIKGDLKVETIINNTSWYGLERPYYEAEIRAFTGPNAKILRAAEGLMREKPDEASAIFEQAMADSKEDKQVHDYLRERAARIRLRLPAFETGGKEAWGILNVAACNGRQDVAQFLLDNGYDINETLNDRTALRDAISNNGKTEMMQFLVGKGADINLVSEEGWTPLMCAVQHKRDEAARFLIDKGAKLDVANRQGATALMLAIECNNPEIAKLLIEEGANLNQEAPSKHYRALDYCIFYNQPEIARLLLDKGADFNYMNGAKAHPLYLTMIRGQYEIAEMLLSKGADPTEIVSDGKWSYPQAAFNVGHRREAILAIEHGAPVNGANANGWTALDLAVCCISDENECMNAVKYLISKGADLSPRVFNDGRNAIDLARDRGRPKVEEYLKSVEKGK